MPNVPTADWLREAARRVNGDPDLERVTGEFEATVVFGIEDTDVDTAVTFADGRMEVIGDSTFRTWDFAFRAPRATWLKLLSETPPPRHHDFVGAWLQADLTLEGDLRLAFRHLRPLKRLFGAFREVEPQ